MTIVVCGVDVFVVTLVCRGNVPIEIVGEALMLDVTRDGGRVQEYRHRHSLVFRI